MFIRFRYNEQSFVINLTTNNHLSEQQKSKQRLLMFYKVKITKIALYYIKMALFSTNQNAVILSYLSIIGRVWAKCYDLSVVSYQLFADAEGK